MRFYLVLNESGRGRAVAISKLKALLLKHEGIVLKPYRCPTGHLTIGIGHNIETGELPEPIQKYLEETGTITEDMAFEILELDMIAVLAQATGFVWFKELTEARQLVVLDMIFNMGLNKFRGFKKTIGYVATENFLKASTEMLDSVWAKQVGVRATTLAKMMREG